MKKGQIQIAIVLSLMATFIAAAIATAWNANVKSDRSLEKVSAVEVDIGIIKTDVKYLRESFIELKQLIKDAKLSKDGIN